MIAVKYKRRIYHISVVYFYNKTELSKQIKNSARVDFVQALEKPVDCKCREKYSLINDLTKDEEVIYDAIDKQTRYEIRRAENKDELSIKFYNSAEITEDILRDVQKFYNNFTAQKKLKSKCDIELLKKAQKQNNLVVSCAIDKDGNTLVWHVYLADDKICRLLYSCSLYRNNDTQFRNLVGRANRLLHYKDMLSFKAAGLEKMDWGGISEREEIKNITAFKKEFGGEPITYYDYRRAYTFFGKIILFILKLLKK